MSVAFVFPGQGSQAVGMGREWAEQYPEAAEIFERADAALGFELSRLCWHGPGEDLQLTENTQPAIVTTSVAMHAVLAERGISADAVAGHSLGEYSALVAAGALEFEDAVRLVRERGRLMQQAVPVGAGAMAAIIGLDQAQVEEAVVEAARVGVCTVANINSPQQLVIAGAVDAVQVAVDAAQRMGATRAMTLPVSAPFHCPLMQPAREALAPLLEDTDFADAGVDVVPNVDPRRQRSAQRLRQALIEQVNGTVRWVECVETMLATGVGTFVEVGPGNVLTGLLRRISRQAKGVSLAGPKSLDGLLEEEE